MAKPRDLGPPEIIDGPLPRIMGDKLNRPDIPLNVVVRCTNMPPGPPVLILDEYMNLCITDGQGSALAIRLSPESALSFAENLYHKAAMAAATNGLSSSAPAGRA